MTEELKERLKKILDKKVFELYPNLIHMQQRHVDNILDALAEAYALDRNEWVSVEEKLPEEKFPVWGALQHWETKNYRYYEIKKVNESDCLWRTVDDNSEISYDWNVTHWQPLPKPPIK